MKEEKEEKAEEKKVPTIWEALKEVSDKMPVIGRNKKADVGKFSYSYADLEKIWETAKPIVEEQGFVVTHLGDGENVVTIVHHKPSDQELASKVKLTQTDPQKKGGEITYYRRYNLCMLFNIIVANEDKDAVGTGSEYDKERLAGIEEEALLMNDLNELTAYYKQLGSPRDKNVLAIFAKRKKQLTK